jgi:uncharacterized protein
MVGRGSAVEGVLAPERMGRLGAVALPIGAFQVRLDFEGAGGDVAAVAVKVHVCGRLRVTCQRCLEPMDMPVRVAGAVLVTRSEAVARSFDADTEALVLGADQQLELDDLVQDEVMLALPFAPAHEPGDCAIPAEPSGAAGILEQQVESERAPRLEARHAQHGGREAASNEARTSNPFAVLASLKDGDRDAN